MTTRQLLIRCPNTGKSVPTGFAMDLATYANITLTDNVVVCPHCGAEHVWSKKDGFWDESQN